MGCYSSLTKVGGRLTWVNAWRKPGPSSKTSKNRGAVVGLMPFKIDAAHPRTASFDSHAYQPNVEPPSVSTVGEKIQRSLLRPNRTRMR